MVRKVSIKDFIEKGSEEKIREAVKNFNCQDKEVENYLKQQALEFDRRNKSRTYLLIDGDNDEELIIWGYYTLTLKTLNLNENLSKSKIKKIDGFRSDVKTTEAVLIGQLGKNYDYKDKITGLEIIYSVFDAIYEVQKIVGSRIVFLECQNHEKIINFYANNGFVFLQNSSDDMYIQMIRYL